MKTPRVGLVVQEIVPSFQLPPSSIASSERSFAKLSRTTWSPAASRPPRTKKSASWLVLARRVFSRVNAPHVCVALS